MDKHGFIDRLILAGVLAREFAESYIEDRLPQDLCFTLSAHDNKEGRRGPPGTIKFLGGRFLKRDDLLRLPAWRAGSLLWVDGKVPAWINIGVCDCSDSKTELMVRFCDTLVPADEEKLEPDVNAPRGNLLVPFRIRGPGDKKNWRTPTG